MRRSVNRSLGIHVDVVLLLLVLLPYLRRPSVLSDLAKTAADLRQANTRALEQLAEAAVPRLRPVLDEVAAVRGGCKLSNDGQGCEGIMAVGS